MTERVVQRLNGTIHSLMSAHDQLVLLGEDIADPYGGAFGVTKGMSTAYPGRVLSTPISEAGITGAAGGLALCGDWAIVEVMFGDFITLCCDPIINFLTKSVSMYGHWKRMPVVVRCPVGGNRAYGPTHSQNPYKLLLGVPHLSLYELSPFHDPLPVFERIFEKGEPAVFFEDKILYTQPMRLGRSVDDLFTARMADSNWVRVGLDADPPDVVILAPGGLSPRVLSAMRMALIEAELQCELVVPARLHPIDLDPILPLLASARRIVVAEDGVAGGGWAGEVARLIYEQLWGRLRHPVRVVQPPCAVIPAAAHLERELLVQDHTVYHALTEDGDAGSDYP